jgi:pyrimidine operon attenuation protein/uracil phosphoribosyltransferase
MLKESYMKRILLISLILTAWSVQAEQLKISIKFNGVRVGKGDVNVNLHRDHIKNILFQASLPIINQDVTEELPLNELMSGKPIEYTKA